MLLNLDFVINTGRQMFISLYGAAAELRGRCEMHHKNKFYLYLIQSLNQNFINNMNQ